MDCTQLKKEQWTVKEAQLKQHWQLQATPPGRKMEAEHCDWRKSPVHWKSDFSLKKTPGSTKKRGPRAENADCRKERTGI